MLLFSEKYRWAWLVCLLLLVGFLVCSIGSYLVSRENLRRTISESTLPLTSDNVYSEIQNDLLRPIFISSLMAHDTFLRDWTIHGEVDTTSITRYLHELKVKYSTVTSFFVSEKTRKYYHAHGLLKTISETDVRDEWYFRVRDMSEPYEINVDLDAANEDEMTIFINYRVLDYAGNFIGVTGVGLTVNNVNRLISRYETKYERQIYFANASGEIVLRPSNSPILNYKGLQDIEGLSGDVDQLLSGDEVGLSYERDGERRLLNCRYVSELKWYLVVEQSEEEMLQTIRGQLLINIILSLLITAVVAWICIAVIKSHQVKMEMRNDELTDINRENERQKADLKEVADELAVVNQRLSALDKEKDEFISIVAHDLRNPLSGIIGLCHAVRGKVMARDEQEQFIEDVEECGERMLVLTQTLLDVSRIEEFQGNLELEAVAWNQVVEATVASLEKEAKRKRISLVTELGETERVIVSSKGDWLGICINNLLSNAIKYTPGYGRVWVRSRLKDNRVEIEIEDTGSGMNTEDKGKMFGKFVRLSAKPTGNESSIGLGLYVVKKMSDRLGIEIRVESTLGEGTTFTLSLPVLEQ